MRNTLNYHCLKAFNACPRQVALFRRVFGDGDIFVTRRDMLKAHAAGLNTTWLWTTLSPAAYAGYQQARVLAWNEYTRTCTAANAGLERAQNAAIVVRNRAGGKEYCTSRCAAAGAHYALVREAACAKNRQALAVAYAKYERERAAALSDVWRGDTT